MYEFKIYENFKAKQEATAIVQERQHVPGDVRADGEQLDRRCILKAELMGFADGLDV